MPGLIAAEGKMVSAQAEFDRVAQRGAADDLHVSTIAEAHLQEPPAQIAISTDSDDAAAAADAQLVQRARVDWPAVIAARKVTCLLHYRLLIYCLSHNTR